MADEKKRHHHYWQLVSSSTGNTITERCRCGLYREREATPEEAKIIQADYSVANKSANRQCGVWHEFCRKFYDEENGRWRLNGFEFMEKASAWAADRRGMHVIFCDDHAHASSLILVFEIAHQTSWMGLTCLYIPQSGGLPAEFFLYPEHHDALLGVLVSLKRVRDAVKKRERAYRRAHWSALRNARCGTRRRPNILRMWTLEDERN